MLPQPRYAKAAGHSETRQQWASTAEELIVADHAPHTTHLGTYCSVQTPSRLLAAANIQHAKRESLVLTMGLHYMIHDAHGMRILEVGMVAVVCVQRLIHVTHLCVIYVRRRLRVTTWAQSTLVYERRDSDRLRRPQRGPATRRAGPHSAAQCVDSTVHVL